MLSMVCSGVIVKAPITLGDDSGDESDDGSRSSDAKCTASDGRSQACGAASNDAIGIDAGAVVAVDCDEATDVTRAGSAANPPVVDAGGAGETEAESRVPSKANSVVRPGDGQSNWHRAKSAV